MMNRPKCKDIYPKNSVINCSPSCHYKPLSPLLIFGLQINILSNATTMFKKGSKDIVEIVHVTSVVQP